MRCLLNLFVSISIFLGVPSLSFSQTGAAYNYYFAHLASGGVWRTTFTYVNPSDNFVTCNTSFYSQSGAPLTLSFAGIKSSLIPYNIVPRGTVHSQTDADPTGPVRVGWAKAVCDGPIQASVLFRSFKGSVPQAEGSVLASTTPSTRFVSFSDEKTGIAFANPLSVSSELTFTARNLAGVTLMTKSLTLLGMNHGTFNVGPYLGLSSFRGSLTIVASSPIVSLALNFESAPVFSALPPGQNETTSKFRIPIA